jgi:hypothetical protein
VNDPQQRGELAQAATRAGKELDLNLLARRYEEILELYIPSA